nr:hypothetical protein [Tanacetum cinerariifolium]
MVAILEKYEHNVDFHQIVNFVEASHIRYALTINLTVYVSHIRQFWSTTRIETTDAETKILVTVDGKPRTISESSIRRNLKLHDEARISSLPDAELFENLTLMGYNISPNQKFTFQKGQFSHQWKYLIHTIMQCLSPKSTSFNEFSSNIATAVVCLATNEVYNFSKMIFDGMVRNVNNKGSKFLMYPRFISKCLKMSQFGQITHSHTYTVPFHTMKIFTTLRVNSPSFLGRTVPLFPTMLVTMGEGSGTPTEPHHTPTPEVQQSPPTAHSSPSLPPVTTESIPTVIPTETPSLLRQYTRRARIAQSSALPTAADEPASPLGDDSQGEAFPTGSMQHKLNELTDLCTRLQRQQTKIASKIAAQELKITSLKARVKLLEDKDGGGAEPSREDATIKRRSLETWEEAVVEKSTERGSNDTEELVAREIEEQIAREDQRMNEQIARDAEIARIHTKEELHMLIDGLDRNNETVAKYLQEYEQFAADLSIGEKIELINDLVKYQDNYAKVLKYQSQQRKPLSKKQQREFYMSVLKSHSGWKTKHFKGVSLEQIREKFIPVWKQIEDFVPMGSKEERERVKRKGLILEHESAKKLWTLVKETPSIRQATSDKEKELWVKLKRLYEHDVEDQLDQEIFMLMERDCPLRKGLAIVMISNKLQVENYSQMANDLILKIHKIANIRRQRDGIPTASDEFPLPEYFPTASEGEFPLLRKKQLLKHRVQDSLSYKRSP